MEKDYEFHFRGLSLSYNNQIEFFQSEAFGLQSYFYPDMPPLLPDDPELLLLYDDLFAPLLFSEDLPV